MFALKRASLLLLVFDLVCPCGGPRRGQPAVWHLMEVGPSSIRISGAWSRSETGLPFVEVQGKARKDRPLFRDLEGNLRRTTWERTDVPPGGIDFDGESIWVPVAEYRARSGPFSTRSIPRRSRPSKPSRGDHIGKFFNREVGTIVGMNWDAQTFYDGPGRQARPEGLERGGRVFLPDCKYLRGARHALFGNSRTRTGDSPWWTCWTST
jgi:hypothetical protein